MIYSCNPATYRRIASTTAIVAGLIFTGYHNQSFAQTSNAQADSALTSLRTQPQRDLNSAQESALSSALLAIILNGKALDEDQQLQRYVNQLGRWLSLQSSSPQMNWTFAVVDDTNVNAWSTPSGHIVLTRGLVDLCADEAALAGILGQEIVHVTARHHTQQIATLAQASAYAPLSSIAQQWFDQGLSANHHYQADREAAVLVARAGIDPFGLINLLHKVGDLTAANDPGFSQWSKTHAPTHIRISQLEQAMGNHLDQLTGKPPATIADRLEMFSSPAAAPEPAPANKRRSTK